jgi:hypothetical protein
MQKSQVKNFNLEYGKTIIQTNGDNYRNSILFDNFPMVFSEKYAPPKFIFRIEGKKRAPRQRSIEMSPPVHVASESDWPFLLAAPQERMVCLSTERSGCRQI